MGRSLRTGNSGSTAAAAALAGLLIGGSAFAQTPGLREVREVFKKPYASDTRTREQVLDQLAGLGSSSIPALYAVYMDDCWEELFGGEQTVDVERWWCPPDQLSELALEALGRFSPKKVVALVDRRTPPDAPHAERVAALRVLTEVKSSQALPTLFRLGKTFGNLPLRYRSVQSPLEQAFHSVFAHDAERASRVLPDLLDDAPDGLVRTLVTAAGRSGREELVPVFAQIVEDGGETGLHALETLPAMVAVAPWRFGDEAVHLAQSRLIDRDWRFRRSCAYALGHLSDRESFGRVVLLLDDGNEAVASAARWAVEQIAGISHPETSTEWVRWHDAETGWWNDHRDALFEDLHSGDPMRVGAALRAFSSHPLFRDPAAREVARLLGSSDESLVVVAIEGLRELGSRRIVPELVWLVDSRNARIASAAYRALSRLTGAKLEADRAAWREYVEG